MAPEVVGFTALTDGQHLVELDPPPAPGQWLKLTLNVTIADSGCSANLNLWLAHHPGDINQDGVVNIRDATAFGEEFGGERREALIDLNGDGVVDIRDATKFGQIWRGEGDNTRAWQGSTLPPKPE